MVERFLTAYRQAAEGRAFYPESAPQADDLIRLFALEKALYEIRYELDNRPAWVGIPIDGVAAMLAQ
jgi:maltose alpha-D-glucosyltransferase/alpha-amylase